MKSILKTWILISLFVGCDAVERAPGVEPPSGEMPESSATTRAIKPGEQVRLEGDYEGRVEQSAHLMGTHFEILVLSDNREEAHAAISAAMEEIARIERHLSSWREDSITTKINQNAGDAPLQVDAEAFDLLSDSRALCDLTEGKFDISFKGVGDLWDFKASSPQIPTKEALKEGVSKVDCRAMRLNPERLEVSLLKPGMAIGLGGIAKGYGVDRAAKVLREEGFQNFVVNGGGDIYASGHPPEGLWKVAIKHPRDPESTIAILPLSNLAIATSGDYERFFERDGRRYHHILDPDSGLPARGTQSVSVLAPAAYLADALATAIFVLGPVQGMALAERLDGVEAAIVDESGEVHISQGLRQGSP